MSVSKVRSLERDFAAHHDAAHYADALGVPAAALSRTLSGLTGHATKELITEHRDRTGSTVAAKLLEDWSTDRSP